MSVDPDTQAWTVARLLQWTRGFFERNRIESPRLCAEILLAHALGCERIELYTRYESIPDEDRLAAFREIVRQAAAGKPVAYLTGVKEFFSLSFEVTPDVLIPRPETEVLVERTIHLIRRGLSRRPAILDLCTGSGCVAISLAKNLPEVDLFASDLSEKAIEVAGRNAARHDVTARIEFRQGDLLAPWKPDRRFDVIVCNPPYVALRDKANLPVNVREYEPALALFGGEDGCDFLRRLAVEIPASLVPDGHFLMEIAYDQADAARAVLEEAGWRDILAYRDGLGIQRVMHSRPGVAGCL